MECETSRVKKNNGKKKVDVHIKERLEQAYEKKEAHSIATTSALKK
ncbi:hypothetical protein [Anoxybacillus sp. KU2-6(11)]|nr:hypothetical protein [Anoxybacillus sp. KU2-6(11)]